MSADRGIRVSVHLRKRVCGEIVNIRAANISTRCAHASSHTPQGALTLLMQVNGLPTEVAFAQTFSRAGLGSMFRSWQSSVVRDVPFGGIQLMLFEGIKAFILTSPDIDLDVTTLQVKQSVRVCSCVGRCLRVCIQRCNACMCARVLVPDIFAGRGLARCSWRRNWGIGHDAF